ncbi:MAG: hypothetical protein WCD53_11545 [Microcoleus sp.]
MSKIFVVDTNKNPLNPIAQKERSANCWQKNLSLSILPSLPLAKITAAAKSYRRSGQI